MIYIHITCDAYLSKPGDTLMSVAQKFSLDKTPQGIKRYLQSLENWNHASLIYWGVSLQNPNLIIPKPHTVICLPPQKRVDGHIKQVDLALAGTHRLGYRGAANLHTFLSHYNLPATGAAAQLTATMQWLSHHAANIAGGTVIGLGDATSDYIKDRANKFLIRMQGIQDKLEAYLKAPGGAKNALKQDFLKSHLELNKDFNKEIQILERMDKGKAGIRFLTDSQKMINLGKSTRHGFNVMSTDAFKSLTKISGSARYVGRGFAAVDLGLIASDTIRSYEHHGHWVDELLDDLAGFAGSWLGNFLTIALLADPLGWVVIIPAVGAGIFAGYEAKKHLMSLLHA